MNQDIKELWVQALRSGEYQQSRNSLRRNGGYCCLGVLCDLYAKEHNVEWQINPKYAPNEQYQLNGCNYMLPSEVVTWAELESQDPGFKKDETEDTLLSYLNDHLKLNFNQIAQVIEEQL